MKYSDKFICAGKRYNTLCFNVAAPYFRREFDSNGDCQKAEITICGLGFYELYFNGKRITKGELAPYVVNPDQIVFYDVYDVTDSLKKGQNVIGVILGNGMQNAPGGAIWNFDKARFRSAPKFSLRYEENGQTMFEADRQFSTCRSPITFDDLRCGTYYDARKETDGWCDLGKPKGILWKPAKAAPAPKGEVFQRLADEIKVERTLAPVEIIKNERGYLYDFGDNVSGVCELKIKGERGQKIYINHGEAVRKEDNTLYPNNITCDGALLYHRKHWQTERYICKGKGEERFTPRFTYNGFRFAEVIGLKPSQATKEALTCKVFHSDIPSRGKFECSDSTLNKLQSAALHSSLANFVFFPTDCPHREKNGWTGDAAISSEMFLLNFKAETSLREWLKCIVRTQRKDGMLPGIIPTGGWGYVWGNGPSWDTVLFTLTYNIYKMTGDKGVIKENASAMARYLDGVDKRRKPDGTISIGLGDWVEVDRPSGKPTTPIAITDTLQCYNMSKMAEFMFGEIGETQKAETARAYKESYYNAFRRVFVNEQTKLVGAGTQTAQGMTMAYGIFSEAELKEAGKRLVEMIRANDLHMRAGMLGTRYIYEALSMIGEDDLAYSLLTNGHYSSPSFSINKGSTTLWETFPDLETGENMRFSKSDLKKISSLNHHFLGGGFGSWYYKTVLGIIHNPSGSNPEEVKIAPHYISSLSFAEGHVNFPQGSVYVKWTRREDGTPELKYEVKGLKLVD